MPAVTGCSPVFSPGSPCCPNITAFFCSAAPGFSCCSAVAKEFWLATPWPFLAGLVALIVFSPVLIWNAQHHWVSFVFQGARSGAPHLQFVAPLALIGLQSLILAPWIFFPLAALFLRALWRGPAQERDFFLACLGAFPIVLFTLVALWSSHRVLPHWAAPGYLMIFPLLGREIAMRRGAEPATLDGRAARWPPPPPSPCSRPAPWSPCRICR